MAEAISNTSPLFYLQQAGALDWLARLFSDVWIPGAVVQELAAGKRQGCDVPDLKACPWARVRDPHDAAQQSGAGSAQLDGVTGWGGAGAALLSKE